MCLKTVGGVVYRADPDQMPCSKVYDLNIKFAKACLPQSLGYIWQLHPELGKGQYQHRSESPENVFKNQSVKQEC